MVYLSVELGGWFRKAQEATAPEPRAHFLSESSVARALAFTEAQLVGLSQARAVLQQMDRIARVAQTASEAGLRACEVEARHLGTLLRQVACSEWHGTRLFSGQTVAVDLGLEGNKLVMAGVILSTPIHREVQAVAMDKPGSAAHALDLIRVALDHLNWGISVLEANRHRLLFYSQHPELAGDFAAHSADATESCTRRELLPDNSGAAGTGS